MPTDTQETKSDPLKCPRCGGSDVSKSEDQSLLGQLIFVCQTQRCRFGGRIEDFKTAHHWSGLIFPSRGPEIQRTILLYRMGEEKGRLITLTGSVGDSPAMSIVTTAVTLGTADLDLNVDEPGFWSQIKELVRNSFGEEAVSGIEFGFSLWSHLSPAFT